MKGQELFEQIRRHFEDVVHQKTKLGKELHAQLEHLHPADAAYLFSLLDIDESKQLFLSLSVTQRLAVFKELSEARQAVYLSFLDERGLRGILKKLSVDELTGFFAELTDEELKRYLKILQERERKQVLSVLELKPDAIGRHMEINVLSLLQEFTVAQSIQILQRLQPDEELHRTIFVTTSEQKLVGYIWLEDLVLKKPTVRLSEIIYKPEFIVNAEDDQESVAQKMVHYNVMTAPVTDKKGRFLGIISGEELVDIIEEESSEDIYRMATMQPITQPYFDTSFFKLLYQRSFILIVLLFAQSLTTMVIKRYEVLLAGFLTYFITALTSTGGNTSSQTSAIVIQGLATGEINQKNWFRFIGREFMMALMIGVVLFVFSYIRIHYSYPEEQLGALAVSLSLGTIVVVSVTLGSCIPLILKKFNLDPAHSAGPLLATIMDIVGIFAYCTICQYILS